MRKGRLMKMIKWLLVEPLIMNFWPAINGSQLMQ